ncbi:MULTISPECIES: alpha/beta fold hydrolase [Pseudanabaena]|uniref:Alpha/beta hydrolase fold protein n=2 Tax=Pseudanabaena TaxID=1152 RepID=L8N6N8_9CYAN|nr:MULTISPECIES: alpha/beta fold hydrolase [Pseudanabaena]ELS34375.1 alpha/beta hydrolase fold protein [Pseudanabaena biceps PCC 7429]MDG3493427.1 alpha/beta fold hydrolase [Pseudanabaena catenata USMAC16]
MLTTENIETLDHQKPSSFQTWIWRGYQIKYAVAGTGTPLVLIHGFGASIGHWKKNMSVWAAAGYQVYAIDLLGFGGSAKPELDYSLELWEELLGDFHQEWVKQPAVWIGNSIGALLALMLVTNSPEIAIGAVLLNAAGGLNHRPEELNLPLRMVMGAFAKLVSSETTGKFVFDLVRRKQNIRNSLRQVYRNHRAIDDALVDMLYQPSCDAGAQKVFASILTAPAGPCTADLLAKVEKPLLVLWGDADPWTPINGAKIYEEAGRTKDIQVIAIPNTGHCPHDDRPEIVNALVTHWLSTTLGKELQAQ